MRVGPEGRPRRRRLNVAERRALRVEAIRLYERQAGRRAQKGVEPNDRRHDREVEQAVSRMNPFDLAALLDGDPSEGSDGTGGGE